MRNSFTLILFFCLSSTKLLFAQNSPLPAGGVATGTGGSVSYSVGQVVYSYNTGATGSLSQGVQQPFEISIVTGITDLNIQLSASIFPNPSSEYFTLTVNQTQLKQMSFVLLDVNGKVLKKEKIINSVTSINTNTLTKGVYFINILNKNSIVKAFKVIKTN